MAQKKIFWMYWVHLLYTFHRLLDSKDETLPFLWNEKLDRATPNQLKERGNQCFSIQDYKIAILFYTAALEKHVDKNMRVVLLVNRSICFFKLDLFQNAKEDCDAAIGIDSKHQKSYFRRALCHEQLGMLREAEQDILNVEKSLLMSEEIMEAKTRISSTNFFYLVLEEDVLKQRVSELLKICLQVIFQNTGSREWRFVLPDLGQHIQRVVQEEQLIYFYQGENFIIELLGEILLSTTSFPFLFLSYRQELQQLFSKLLGAHQKLVVSVKDVVDCLFTSATFFISCDTFVQQVACCTRSFARIVNYCKQHGAQNGTSSTSPTNNSTSTSNTIAISSQQSMNMLDECIEEYIHFFCEKFKIEEESKVAVLALKILFSELKWSDTLKSKYLFSKFDPTNFGKTLKLWSRVFSGWKEASKQVLIPKLINELPKDYAQVARSALFPAKFQELHIDEYQLWRKIFEDESKSATRTTSSSSFKIYMQHVSNLPNFTKKNIQEANFVFHATALAKKRYDVVEILEKNEPVVFDVLISNNNGNANHKQIQQSAVLDTLLAVNTKNAQEREKLVQFWKEMEIEK